MKILITDDDKEIVELLTIYATNEDYEVIQAFDGDEALKKIAENPDIAMMVLDIMMPGKDGITVIKELRKRDVDMPILLLSAKSSDMDKISGLTTGADDYVTKPFNTVELQARVKSQLRRYMKLGGGTVRPDTIVIGGIELNDVTKEVTLDGDKVQLTRTEYDILKLLMQHPGQVFSPNEIYEKVWNDNPFRNENTVAVHIRHLREKVEYNPAEPRHLKVVWGRGYKMEV